MVAFNKFFSSVLLAVLYASYGNAAPSTTGANHSTHRVRNLGRGLQVEAFHPASNYQTFGEGLDLPASFGESSIEDKTVEFVASQLKVDSENISFKSGFTSEDGATYGYAKQFHNGIPFNNAVANVAFKNNKAVAFGSSFVTDAKFADSTPTVDVNEVIPKVEEALQGKKNDIEPTLEYLALQDGTAALVHVFQVQNEEEFTFYEAYVDAHSGELVSVTDFVADASYKVLPIWKQDPREGLETLTNPQITTASPNGWHLTSGTTTEGNNVVAYKGALTATTTQSSSGQNFIYTYDPAQAPAAGQNVDAARTNAFYIVNAYHDTLYLYGFTERAYNFQNDNFGKGGAGNDRVRISVQDASGTNNANFATPPDGQPGQCRMYIWTRTTPNRDGVVQNDIPIHEVTHGLTNRMTGGGTGRCLQTTEAGGMGEGWSDALADWFSHSDTATVSDFTLGDWVYNTDAGIRSRPYSTSTTTNPYLYSRVGTLTAVHSIGELVAANGWSSTARTNASGTSGNVVWLRLVVNALSLQPCNPTFVSARDAIIQADQNLFAGAHRCLLWRVFASRGLGQGAANFRDSTTVPSGC
ncbi:hypothetical protein PM082_006581 [Marasmius tenuissimus]|nr:hypothetical protein PM082_006581 [Marasmius tenuissimus]